MPRKICWYNCFDYSAQSISSKLYNNTTTHMGWLYMRIETLYFKIRKGN